MKPLLSNKCTTPENTAIAERNDAISGNSKIADLFNELFADVVTNLNNTVLRAIEKYKKQSSIKAIAHMSKINKFTLEEIPDEDMYVNT